jgi:hypothetical protein
MAARSARQQVSAAGGRFPVWSRATKQLLNLGADDRVMEAGYSAGETFTPGKPEVWMT